MKAKYWVAISTLLVSSVANAFYPVDGWWWFNPSEPGTGINIEMQDDTMFVALFHYNNDGSQAWWLASGEFDHDSGRFESNFISTANGQCPGCAWVSPEIMSPGNAQVTINFQTANQATMTWAGGTTSLVRQYFDQFDVFDPRTFMLGAFHFTNGGLGVYFGDWLIIDDLYASDGDRFFSGHIRDRSSRILVGQYVEENDEFVLLLDSSTDFYKLFVYRMTKDRIEGRSWVYRKGESPTGSGLMLIGHRSASRSFVQSGSGPHAVSGPSSTALPSAVGDVRGQIDEILHNLQGQDILSEVSSENSGVQGVDIQNVAIRLEGYLPAKTGGR